MVMALMYRPAVGGTPTSWKTTKEQCYSLKEAQEWLDSWDASFEGITLQHGDLVWAMGPYMKREHLFFFDTCTKTDARWVYVKRPKKVGDSWLKLWESEELEPEKMLWLCDGVPRVQLTKITLEIVKKVFELELMEAERPLATELLQICNHMMSESWVDPSALSSKTFPLDEAVRQMVMKTEPQLTGPKSMAYRSLLHAVRSVAYRRPFGETRAACTKAVQLYGQLKGLAAVKELKKEMVEEIRRHVPVSMLMATMLYMAPHKIL